MLLGEEGAQWTNLISCIALPLVQAAGAPLVAQVRGETPFAGVHSGDEHEVGGEHHGAGGSRDRDARVFQRLAQDLERLAPKFGKLVR